MTAPVHMNTVLQVFSKHHYDIGEVIVRRSRSRSRNFILSTTNQPKKIEELPGPPIEARQETEGATRHHVWGYSSIFFG